MSMPIPMPMLSGQTVLASANAGKIREFTQILAPLTIKLTSQTELGVPDVAETGLSFVENAIIKARHAAEYTQLPAMADDSGLQVDALNGAPGIYSARYAGEGASDEDNLQLLRKNLAERGNNCSLACFQCVIVYLRSHTDAMPVIAQGSWHGEITMRLSGKNGFAYDPIFYLPGHGCTAAELPAAQKNKLSHRGQALQQLLQKLSTLKARQ